MAVVDGLMRACARVTLTTKAKKQRFRGNLLVPESFENGDEYVAYNVYNLVVVVVERHLQIQPHELRQMPMGIRIFGAEN